MSGAGNEDLFSSVAAEIKAYQGKDPLCPWLRGIRRMQESLPRKTLSEKLPRFLQRCVEKFECDRRYRSDIRYLRVWFQLMDHVDDPRGILRRMEKNEIGVKCSAFYVAYSMTYEKQKKFDAAEKMYILGAERYAEPADELQKSYDQFLLRAEDYKRRKSKLKEANCMQRNESKYRSSEFIGQNAEQSVKMANQVESKIIDQDCRECDNSNSQIDFTWVESNAYPIKQNFITNEDTVVVKFVGSAIVGKTTAEDACHHGLVDPTVNMKEAMNDINSMFREPLDIDLRSKRKVQQNPSRSNPQNSIGFEIFVDEPPETNPTNPSNLEIFVDDEPQGSFIRGFNDGDCDDDDNTDDQLGHAREDTVVCRFVGSTIAGDRVVENACHNGLVDPTLNLKQAIDDINGMFGKPIDFVSGGRQKREGRLPVHKQLSSQQEFSILVDDDLAEQAEHASSGGGSRHESGLFEPTVFTKEAMDDINDLFSRPLNF